MKKILICSALILMILMSSICFAATIPQRYATKVEDVFGPYTTDDWIVSPEEEPEGDQITSQVLESDILGVIASYDEDYLRVDILLHNSVSFKWQNYYTISFVYTNMIEYYTYYTDKKELVYTREKNGEIVKQQTLDLKKSDDQAGITTGGEVKNDDVYFIINKNKHLAGEKGKTYFLTTSFSAGYVDVNNNLVKADETIDIDLYFVK